MIFRKGKSRSGLLKTLGAPNLTLDLFTSPASCIDGSCLEVTVLAGILNHLGEPFGTVEDREFAVGESLGEITMTVSKNL